MALIPEDRKTEGLMLPMSVRENLSFAALDRLTTAGVIDRAAEQRRIDSMIQLLGIKTAGLDLPVGSELALRFTPPGQHQPIEVAAFVVRAIDTAESRSIGVAFRLAQPSVDALARPPSLA